MRGGRGVEALGVIKEGLKLDILLSEISYVLFRTFEAGVGKWDCLVVDLQAILFRSFQNEGGILNSEKLNECKVPVISWGTIFILNHPDIFDLRILGENID